MRHRLDDTIWPIDISIIMISIEILIGLAKGPATAKNFIQDFKFS